MKPEKNVVFVSISVSLISVTLNFVQNLLKSSLLFNFIVFMSFLAFDFS